MQAVNEINICICISLPLESRVSRVSEYPAVVLRHYVYLASFQSFAASTSAKPFCTSFNLRNLPHPPLNVITAPVELKATPFHLLVITLIRFVCPFYMLLLSSSPWIFFSTFSTNYRGCHEATIRIFSSSSCG